MTTKCDKCGDESNSLPDLPCGRSLGLDADGEETQPPYCDGMYRPRVPLTPSAPEHPVFVRPAWGLTHAIPEGTVLAWGARAIYGWRQVTEPVKTSTGRVKTSKGRPVTRTTYAPAIDLLWDRMGWSSLKIEGVDRTVDGSNVEEIKPLGMDTMARWIDDKGIPAIKVLCRERGIQTDDDGPAARVEYTSDGYTIVACPNGSCGYLYIAAWRHVS